MYSRVHLNVRVGQTGVEWLDTLAVTASVAAGKPVTRSEVIRAALAVARKHEAEILASLQERL